MADNAAQQNKKRKAMWKTSYSAMTMQETEEQLGIQISEIKPVSVQTMLANAKHDFEVSDVIKEKVYDQIMQYLHVEGYPEDSDPDFREANISDLVYGIIGPTIQYVRKKTKCMIRLARGKEIVSVDNDMEEFVALDIISVSEEKFVFIAGATPSAFGQAKKLVLLSMKDARDNGGGTIYGFVTTGEHWQMFRYDGNGFCLSRKLIAVFAGMDEDKWLWMKDCSVLVDCVVAALSSRSIVKRTWLLPENLLLWGLLKVGSHWFSEFYLLVS